MITRKVRPDQIDVSEAFYGAFGKHEAELAARVLVSYAQHRDNWLPFTKAEISNFVGHPFDFGGLITMDFIIEKHGRCEFTDRFIDKCLAAIRQRDMILREESSFSSPDGA